MCYNRSRFVREGKDMQGVIKAACISEKKGTEKHITPGEIMKVILPEETEKG